MKSKHFFWGALFITLGVLILLNNFYYLNFGWSDLWKFWPIVLVLWGLTIVIKNTYFKGVLAGASGLLLALVIFATFKAGTDIFTNNFDWDSKDFSISIDDSDNYNSYKEAYDPAIKEATFHFESGAGSFVIRDTTPDLISAKTNGIDYNFIVNKDVGEENITLSGEEHHFRFGHGKFRNKVEVALNTNPVWDLNLEVGAAATDFDLRQYKTRRVDVSMGAASLKLRLGENVEESNVKVEGGASSIEIFVPENAGCDIRTDIALSSKSFNGFNRISSDHFRTSNFDSAKNKIYLDISTGVSSVKVIRINY